MSFFSPGKIDLLRHRKPPPSPKYISDPHSNRNTPPAFFVLFTPPLHVYHDAIYF